MEELVERWNNVLSELNNPEKFNSSTKFYKKITKDLKEMLPTDLFKKWKSKVHKIAKKIEESVSTHLKEINVETLKKHIKAWVEPTFMKHKENLEEEKQMVQGIFPNYTLYCVVVFFKYCDWNGVCLLYTSPSPRDATLSRMPSSA